jgi:hypothetical protein
MLEVLLRHPYRMLRARAAFCDRADPIYLALEVPHYFTNEQGDRLGRRQYLPKFRE